MSELTTDPMWPIFRPLWADLRAVGGDSLLLAGGYGLFLKQTWLLDHPKTLIIVPMGQWRTPPRVTQDFDLVIGLDIIAEQEAQERLLAVLERHAFAVSEKNPRWQFEKSVADDRRVRVELHAPLPPTGHSGLRADSIRVKRKPSLGIGDIHGRTNREAVGCDLRPFSFALEGIPIAVTNPATWCIMKLTAMQDQWVRSEEVRRSEKDRTFCREQAIKHAQDVCRIVAMVARDERDAASEVLDSIGTTPQCVKAAGIFAEFFQPDGGWGMINTRAAWATDDIRLIRDTLASWFSAH
jgi:hypothetical protein